MISDNLHAELLTRIENELRRLGLWSESPPPADALKSRVPFCYDTLGFEQWLQWVFLPRFWSLLKQGASLPPHSGIAPMAEVYFEQKSIRAVALIAALHEFDRLIENG